MGVIGYRGMSGHLDMRPAVIIEFESDSSFGVYSSIWPPLLNPTLEHHPLPFLAQIYHLVSDYPYITTKKPSEGHYRHELP